MFFCSRFAELLRQDTYGCLMQGTTCPAAILRTKIACWWRFAKYRHVLIARELCSLDKSLHQYTMSARKSGIGLRILLRASVSQASLWERELRASYSRATYVLNPYLTTRTIPTYWWGALIQTHHTTRDPNCKRIPASPSRLGQYCVFGITLVRGMPEARGVGFFGQRTLARLTQMIEHIRELP